MPLRIFGPRRHCLLYPIYPLGCEQQGWLRTARSPETDEVLPLQIYFDAGEGERLVGKASTLAEMPAGLTISAESSEGIRRTWMCI